MTRDPISGLHHRSSPGPDHSTGAPRRRSRLRRVAAAAGTVVLGLGLSVGTAVGTAGSSQAAASPAADSIGVLMKSFDPGSGRIGGGWWTGAVALSTVEQYEKVSGDRQYDYAMTQAFAKNSNFTNEYIDDTGWWALAWEQAYDLTGNQNYLNMARTTTNYMHNYWDSTCGGGVYWSTEKKYKASIANELFLAAAAGLHNRIPGDTQYLGWANDEWNWFKGTGLINSSNVVQDGLNAGDCSHSTATYTYNSGVILGGLAELSKATGNAALLTTAKTIATAATTKWNKNGVLFSGCEPNCGGDGAAFNGIFMRYLGILAVAANTTQYDTFLKTTAASILVNDTNSTGQQGNSYVGPFANWSYNTQAGAAEAVVAAQSRTTPAPPAAPAGTVKSGIAGKCLDVSGANPANGTHVQLWSCNGTVAQVWSTPGGTLRALGKCLDATATGTANYTKVQLWDCNGGANQVWQAGNGGYRNPVSGRCLDDPASSTTDGTQLQLFDCNGTGAQKWSTPA